MSGPPFNTGSENKMFPSGIVEYYAKYRYHPKTEDHRPFESRSQLLGELKNNLRFVEFWNEVQERYPDEKVYFASLLDPNQDFNASSVWNDYLKFLQRKEFENLTLFAKQALEAEYSQVRFARYKNWKAKWEQHLYLDDASNILQRVPSVGYNYNQTPFNLEVIPNDVLFKILGLLSTLDIAKMTLVCKGWKNLIYSNARELMKAEYTMSSFLLEYADYKYDLAKESAQEIQTKYEVFTTGILNWYCNISENLNTLILHHHLDPCELAPLLQKCPNLKHLQLQGEAEEWFTENSLGVQNTLSLPQLEILICNVRIGHGVNDFTANLVEKSSKLRVLKCSVFPNDYKSVKPIYDPNNTLSNLVALELQCYTLEVVQAMAKVEEYQLRYLSLGVFIPVGTLPEQRASITKLRNYFAEILPKLKSLEVLATHYRHLSGINALSMVTELQMNLKCAVFREQSKTTCSIFVNDPSIDKNEMLDARMLRAFKNMLLSQNPNKDMSRFVFLMDDEDRKKDFEAMNLGFSFEYSCELEQFIEPTHHTLEDPDMIQRLNLQY